MDVCTCTVFMRICVCIHTHNVTGFAKPPPTNIQFYDFGNSYATYHLEKYHPFYNSTLRSFGHVKFGMANVVLNIPMETTTYMHYFTYVHIHKFIYVHKLHVNFVIHYVCTCHALSCRDLDYNSIEVLENFVFQDMKTLEIL